MPAKRRIAATSIQFNLVATCETLENRRLLSGLTGSIIGTSGSWHSLGNASANAFDGNVNTFFDAPDGSGDWVGLNLGAPAIISDVKYSPRATFASRMVGGTFQGSSTADFSSGVVNLFTITAAPAYGMLTTAPVSSAIPYQYVRYIGPSASYCNISELEFDGTTLSNQPLPFNASGTAGSWQNMGNVFTKAFDGNLNTFFDGPTGNGNFVEATFSSEAIVSQIMYAPRTGYASRMVGGIFQGSNSAAFTAGAVNLYTITTAPAAGVYTTVPIAGTAAYEYARYVAPAGSFGNIAELAFDGTLTGVQPTVPVNPSVTNSSPANGATGVNTTAFVSCNLSLPNGGVNPDTLSASTVYLYRTFDQTIIPTEVNTDAAGSVIVLQPQSPLAADTQYTFIVTAGVLDDAGKAFTPYTMTFTTGEQAVPSDPTVAFARTALPTAVGQMFSGVTIGPDGDLYANTLTGGIFQYPVNANGTLGNPINIAALANMPDRLITGIAFDPSSTATHMIMWISSGDPAETNAPDFSGTIGTISITGTTVSPYQVEVTGLPRSNSNHLNDQPVFGPDGALYWCQGSNSSMGAPDDVWGYRPEHLLNAAILRLNIQLIEQYVASNKGPLNVQTDSLPAGQTAYNPYAANAPLTIYATGIRNAYDLIWDTNGHLYAPTNGSASGGNIPATPAGVTPSAPAENDVSQAEDDYLYDIVQGGYYGHPDPARGQYIFGGANPIDPASNDAIQSAYPLGTNPDPNYRGYAYDFGVHYSPDGSIEYTGNAFGGALNGALLITEYSGGKDVIALRTGSSGQITGAETGIAGFTGFEDPVDITEDPATGDLYVADLGNDTITLLTPISSGATISVSTPTLYFDAPVNGAASPVESFTITNTGTQPLAIPATGLSVSGADGVLFPFGTEPALPAIVAPGASITVGIVFNPGNSSIGVHTAILQISSNDLVNPLVTVNLRGIATGGLQPTLPQIVSVFDYGALGNETLAAYWTRAASNMPVTVEELAAYSGKTTGSTLYWYPQGHGTSDAAIVSIPGSDTDSLLPLANAATGVSAVESFSTSSAFGFSIDKTEFSDDTLNAHGSATDTGHHVEFYAVYNSAGVLMPNTWLLAMSYTSPSQPYAYTDNVYLISNMRPAPPALPTGAMAVGNSSGITFSWKAVSDPLVAGYLVYRSLVSNTAYVALSNAPVTGTSFVDTTATPGVKYYYTVAAIDSFGSLSPWTSAVSATRTVTPAVSVSAVIEWSIH